MATEPMRQNDVIVIDATCVIEVDGNFFLLARIVSEAPDVDINQIVVLCISEEDAESLLDAGVEPCQITDTIPEGLGLEFRCVVNLAGEIFLVYQILDEAGTIVLVRAPECPVICQNASIAD